MVEERGVEVVVAESVVVENSVVESVVVADKIGSRLSPRRRKARAEKSSERNSAGPILAWQWRQRPFKASQEMSGRLSYQVS